MAKVLEYDVGDVEQVCKIGKALSSPIRLEMFQLLSNESLIIGEIAKKMGIPASSTAFHLKMLAEAGLIRMEEQPGTRGNTKLCTRRVDRIHLNLFQVAADVSEVFTVEMPIGAYTRCEVKPTCGLGGEDGIIVNEDQEFSMYMPERLNAGILWGSNGYVEYCFPNGVPHNGVPGKVRISMEICSEAPGFREDWPSDITVWMNGKDCGTWTSPGDFGERRGRLNPSHWPSGATQYGKLVVWEVDSQGCHINGESAKGTDTCLQDLCLMDSGFVTVKIGNKPDAENNGGFNIFGKHFGDYNQDILFSIEYLPKKHAGQA